jgi:hypothetical protein
VRGLISLKTYRMQRLANSLYKDDDVPLTSKPVLYEQLSRKSVVASEHPRAEQICENVTGYSRPGGAGWSVRAFRCQSCVSRSFRER